MPRVRRCREPGCHEFATVPNYYCNKHANCEEKNKQDHWHYNHVSRFRNKYKAEQNKFYHTKEWKELRQVVLQRDYYLCKYCNHTEGNVVDHVVPIEFDMSKMRDANNLVTCCSDCHAKKTAWEHQYYGTGQKHKAQHVREIANITEINKLMNAM